MLASVYDSDDDRILKQGMFLFPDWMETVTLMKGGRSPQLIFLFNRRDTETLSVNMTISTILEVVIFFHRLLAFNHGLQQKKTTVPGD